MRASAGEPYETVAEQLARHGVKPSDVRLPTPRKAKGMTPSRTRAVRVAPGEAQWQWGMFGEVAHQWAENVKADCSGYVTKCGKYQRSHLVEPPEGAERCGECEEVQE